ncbi:FecR domain-containing protein [Candidatus Omnitrophota bacterium]
MKTIYILTIFLAVLLICVTSHAQSATPVGKIAYIEGVVDIMHAGSDTSIINQGQDVFIGDRIRTKKYSKAEIKFNDKSVVKIAPSTCIIVDKYLVEDNKRIDANINLTRGKLQAVVAKTGKPDTFIITTPNATGKVKGSNIFVYFQAGKTGALVDEGLMSLTTHALPKETVKIGKGDYSISSFDKAPIEPRQFFEAEIKSHKKDVAPAVKKKWVFQKGATQMTGLITKLSGDVQVYKKGASDWQTAQPRQIIQEGDKLQTQETGKVELRLTNGNTIFLQEKTELIITKMRYDPNTGSYQNEFESNRGKIKAVIEKLGEESTFEIKTPTSVCGVEGTTMFLNIQPISTQAYYEGGAGRVRNTISGVTQRIGPGQNTQSGINGTITPPVFTTSAQRTSMNQRWGGGTVMDGYSTPTGSNTGTPLGIGTTPGTGTGSALSTSANTTQDTLNTSLDTLTFNDVHSTTSSTVTNIYDNSLTELGVGTTFADFTSGTAHLILKSDNSWSATLEGVLYTGATPGSNWRIIFETLGPSPIDSLLLQDDGDGGWSDFYWSTEGNTHVSGSVNTMSPAKNISSTVNSASGTYCTDTWTFEGKATGEWSESF